MKKIILSLAFTAVLISCQEKTREKLDEAGDAVVEDVTTTMDSAKIKAEARLDTLKDRANARIDSVKIKNAERLEEEAKKLRESVKK